MRLFKLIEGSLYRSPLVLLNADDPLAQHRSFDLGRHHASRGYNPAPQHPKVSHPQAYLAGYAHHKQQSAAGAAPKPQQGSGPRPAAPKPPAAPTGAPHPIHRTTAGQIMQKRRCLDKGETHQAVQSLGRSLASIKRNAHISGPHERKVQGHMRAAMSAEHPEDAHQHISHALDAMKPFYQKAPARPDLKRPGLTPRGKDPRLGHLFYGLPKAPQGAPQ